MGKAERNRRQSAQQKIATQRAAARRAERRRQVLLVGGSVAAVLAIVVAFVIVKVVSQPAKAGPSSATGTTLAASTISKITSVPASTLNAVGKGTTYPNAIQTIHTAASPLIVGGKPAVVYVGAEYCPYCAAERWALTIALSRFGTFSGLHGIHSAPSPEVYPNTPTLTFYKTSYTSNYLVFETTEAQTVTHATLEKLTPLDNQLMSKYDVPPYVPSSQYDGSFPFIDFGNSYVIDGASFSPQLLAGATWAQVAAALSNPSSPTAKGVDGAANLITAALCKITNNQPASVCSSAGVTAATGAI